MHIALLTHHYHPETGAPQRRWRAFTRRFIRAGHRVTVLTPPPHHPQGYVEGGLPEHQRPGSTETGEWGETILRVRFREHDATLISRSKDQAVVAADSVRRGLAYFGRNGNRPDVIIATCPGLPTVPAGLALGKLLRRPVVVEMRDAWPDLIAPSGMMDPHGYRKRWKQRVIKAAHRTMESLQRRAALVVTTTESFGQVLRERGLAHVATVRNGSTLEILPVLDPPQPHEGLNVLYLGTLGRSQGLTHALDAAKIARDLGLDLNLRFVGHGADADALRAKAERIGLPLDFVGRVPREEIFEHYAWADTCLVSLRAWAPFDWTIPSKLYEVMGVGRHVSAAVRGEAAEIITSAEAGFVTEPENPEELALQWLNLAKNRERLDVGPGPRRWVMHNAHHDNLAASYLDVLQDVLAR